MATPVHGLRCIWQLPRQVWSYATLEPVTWLPEEGLAACRYPRGEGALRNLAANGVAMVINLHERAHPPGLLVRHGLAEVHLPVRDFTAPTLEQLEQGVAAIQQVVGAGRRVAVHCGAGLGRTGTMVACYLVSRGLEPGEAIAHIRAVRPGSVETAEQEAAVRWFAERVARQD